MEAGAGSSHGLAGTDNTLFRVNPDGTTTTVADLSAFVKNNPVANPEPSVPPGDFEPDGTWYGMVAVRGALYATEPNHQEVDKITPDGQIARVIDMSVQFPGSTTPSQWVGPTGIAYHGNFYVGTLGEFPVAPGTESIYKVTPSGQLSTAATGLTAVTAVAFDARGNLYALETDTVAGFPGPAAAGTGAVVRVNGDGTLTAIATGLVFPTAMTFGPDGALYVSNVGFGDPNPGDGQIVRIDLSHGAAIAPAIRVAHGATAALAPVVGLAPVPGLDGGLAHGVTWTTGTPPGTPGSAAAAPDDTAPAPHATAPPRTPVRMSPAEEVDQLFANLDGDFLAPAIGFGVNLSW
jgi:hypothetical protein